MPSYDVLITGGTVIDGCGGSPALADVAIRDGVIVEVARKIAGTASRVIRAEGHVVCPGWIDPHTHFDGQVTWDDQLEPAFGHGVTTAIMGNCGVGFAPVRPERHQELIDIMEGVEDIPGAVLQEAMPWGKWESYPEYLDYLRSRRYALNVGSHISHSALRAFVVGTEDLFGRSATPDQIAQMAKLVEEGVRAGAMGLSTNRAIGHRARSGEPVPGTFAAEDELLALTTAMGRTGHGVLQLMPGGGMGALPGVGADWTSLLEEVALMGRLSRASGRPVTFTLFQLRDDPEAWREILTRSDDENAAGAQLHPQVALRQPGLLMSLSGYHPLMRRETYLKLRHLPLEARRREMMNPPIKAAILADRDIPDEAPGSMENFLCGLLKNNLGRLFPLGADVCYEPEESETIAGLAKARGDTEASVFYDELLAHEGCNVLVLAETNYVYGNFEAVREMFLHPSTISGLSDAGAHVRFICDASMPTHTLSYFTRDRTRGPLIPIEAAVAKLTGKIADVYGIRDRGRIRPNMRADINVIDYERLRLDLPRTQYDLPSGAGRFLQRAHGYRATLVNGVFTREHDEDTGARPGRVLSS